ncbi:serine threonine-protein kinase BRI1-like [Seminavis robusta]|uniref:non-specific serine/threonine protein kinase n=1 Tax=Seminavis robusta TaxID=568900 RepID=A0A9N8ED76_9STRA|nr:serine threonine-protein kinase BRI1-like [Seminavis robusta]|eukprot:Sro779_g201250.1 serine threonine-protein kinase BRI1-like (594) ;mRNA; f:15231-17248
MDCSDFDNAIHCSVTRGCKWDPSADPLDMDSLGEYMTYLVVHGVSNAEDFIDDDSPQSRALQFIAVDDGLNLSVPDGDLDTPEGYEFVTRYALTVLYYSTMGDRWVYTLNFLRPLSVCYWYSELQYPDESSEFRGVYCERGEGEPLSLLLERQNMEGSLPAEISFITSLTDIDVDFNMLSGSIPESYGQLTGLTNFYASSNRLVGSFPAWLVDLGQLENINLSHNYFTGMLPSSIGTMESIIGIAIDNNLFDGGIQDAFDTSMINGLRNLEQFYIENNQFTGALGPNFMKNLTKLEYLDISDNYFNGTVDVHLFELPQLKVLDLHDNEFDTLPDQFPVHNNFTFLALQKCNFSSQTIPSSISNLRALKHLDLSQNEFTGEIPSTIGAMTDLTYLFLAENDFVANSIPGWIEGLAFLEELSLKSTQRTGTIPSFLGDLTYLVLLDLDNNNLVGNIPSELGNLSELHVLLLNRNNLTSTIPDSFADLRNLKLIFLDANDDIQGDLDALFCSNPLFLIKPVIVASCDVCDAAAFDCCTSCCEGTSECNPGIHVPDLDPIWQLNYDRVFFTFAREDFFDKNKEPLEAAVSRAGDSVP